MTWERTLRFSDVNVGENLPPLALPLTVTGIVATAIATRDFQDVHHDLEAARASGTEHVFMNILTSTGYVERFVTEWAGANAILKSIKIRLGVPNYPGDVMMMTGTVTARSADAERCIDVAVTGVNSRGNHLTGSVRLQLAP